MARPASAARIAAHARWEADYRERAARAAYVAAIATAPVQGCEPPPVVPEGVDVLDWLLSNIGA